MQLQMQYKLRRSSVSCLADQLPHLPHGCNTLPPLLLLLKATVRSAQRPWQQMATSLGLLQCDLSWCFSWLPLWFLLSYRSGSGFGFCFRSRSPSVSLPPPPNLPHQPSLCIGIRFKVYFSVRISLSRIPFALPIWFDLARIPSGRGCGQASLPPPPSIYASAHLSICILATFRASTWHAAAFIVRNVSVVAVVRCACMRQTVLHALYNTAHVESARGMWPAKCSVV